MEQFRIMYKILKILSQAMYVEERDPELISPEGLDVSKAMLDNILQLLADEGYISGLTVKQYAHQSQPAITGYSGIKITMRGLEYLEENSMMRKAANLAKGIKDSVPFL